MKKKKQLFRGFILLVMISCIWLVPSKGLAEENEKAAGFTVEAMIPENQVDITKTFFYLKVEPNTPQTIKVKVRSTQEAPVTVKLSIHDAISSSVGAIDYAKVKPKLDESLKNPITEIVALEGAEKEITVQNFEEKIVSYTIQPPAASFPGVKLGSLRFVKKEKDAAQGGVASEYAYLIALMLTEDGEQFNYGADLKLKTVDLKLSNGRKVVAATIQNDQPKVMREMVIEGEVKKKGTNNVLCHNRIENFSVAPNSNFDFEMGLDLNDVSPGTYVFTGKAKADGKTWEWEEEFTVDSRQAAKINKETVFKLVIPGWVLWAAIGLILTFMGLIAYLIRRQRQWQKKRGE